MPTTSGKSLTLRQVARTIFRTSAPTKEQVQRVYELMKVGAIPVHDYGMSPLKWTTSEAALAEFLAAQQMHKAAAHRRGAAPSTKLANEALVRWTAMHQQESQQMHHVYRNIWREYFLAVMMRRRTTHQSRAFQHAVLAGQIATVVLVVALVLGTVRGISHLQKPAEHAVVERWINENTDEFRVTRWHPVSATDTEAREVRVKYRYRKESPRWVHTDRTFRVTGEEVTELTP